MHREDKGLLTLNGGDFVWEQNQGKGYSDVCHTKGRADTTYPVLLTHTVCVGFLQKYNDLTAFREQCWVFV